MGRADDAERAITAASEANNVVGARQGAPEPDGRLK